MLERKFFIDILKSTPNDSFVETTGYVDSQTAKKLGLILFRKFMPREVALTFKINSSNRKKWIEYFEKADIIQLLTHYWIYKQETIIAIGFDFFESNDFDKKYYSGCFQKYENSFNISYENTISSGIPEPELKRKIEILKVNDYQGNYSLEIKMELNNEKLNLRFEIDKFDFKNIKELLSELRLKEKLEFNGSYLGGNDISSLGITLKSLDKEIDLTIDSSKRIISNLLWFQQLDNRKEIEKLIIKKSP